MRIRSIVCLVICAALLACTASCSTSYKNKGWQADWREASFDAALLSFAAQNTDGNFMVSPVSFMFALGLLLEGADGETREQLLKAAGMSYDEFREYTDRVNALAERFEKALADAQRVYDEDDSGVYGEERPSGALRVANSIWKNEDTEDFLESYKKAVGYYDAECFEFSKSDVIRRVNAWADEKTEGMIPELIPETYDVSALKVVLMNALYYQNSWIHKFTDAGKRDFTTDGGEKVSKDYIEDTRYYLYYKDAKTELCAVGMNYGIYMTFVIGDTTGIEKKIAKAEPKRVKVLIPKLDVETELGGKELCEFLKGRGATAAFEDGADFGKMLPETQVKVSDIIQKTRLKLDEKGVEAAAVTGVFMNATASPWPARPVVFEVNRPFTFYIGSLPSSGESGEAYAAVNLFEGAVFR